MRFLKDMPKDQRSLVVALPYRVGLCVSEADKSGGDEADQRELQVLENILHGFAQEVFGSEAVQHIMSETLKHKDKWGGWGKNLDRVPDDCAKVIDNLNRYIDAKEVNAVRQRLLEIAEAVALAFREYEELDFKTRLMMHVHYYKGAMKARLQKRDYISLQRFLNISPDERVMLGRLSKALGLTYL